MQDVITRELVLNASQARVYSAIADPTQVVKWFPETLEGDYTPGAQPVFGFGDHGRNQVLIVAADPHHYFAYRWLPGARSYLGDVREIATTLVEFRLEAVSDNQCKLTLTESGFTGLPADYMEAALKQNSGGWDFMLGRLSTFMQNAA